MQKSAIDVAPELLDDLAAALVASGFDTNYLVRAITRTAAYQRTSKATDKAQSDPRQFARMNVKGLSPEQLFDSLALATGYREEIPVAARAAFGVPTESPRGQYLAKFAGGGQRTDAQTSILQALTLMNGNLIGEATTVESSRTLAAIVELPDLTHAERIEAIYLTALGRSPRPEELRRALAHVEAGGTDKLKERCADVLWALLNGVEFRTNH